MKRKTKLIIVTECPYSGILRAIIENVKIFNKLNFDIVFVLPKNVNDRYGEQLETNKKILSGFGLVFTSLMTKKYSKIFTETQQLNEIVLYIRKTIFGSSDVIVVSYGSYAGKLCRFLYLFGAIKKLYHAPHLIDIKRMSMRYKIMEYIFERMLASSSTTYVACSPSGHNDLVDTYGILPEKILIVPNAVAPTKVKKRINRDLQYVVIGRLVASKRVDTLLSALRNLGLEEKIVVIGDGPELNKMKKDFPLVNFLGHVSSKNIFHYLKRAKYILSNSIIEGLPFSIIEAMSCGVVPVLSNIRGHYDIVENGYNGYIFENFEDLMCSLLKIECLNNDVYDKLSINAIVTSNNLYRLNNTILTNHFDLYD